MDNKVYKKIEVINKLLEDNNFWADTYPYHDLPVVCVEISKGDWKHDHWRCDEILEEAGFVKMSEKTIWENGSDCYSSIHYFA